MNYRVQLDGRTLALRNLDRAKGLVTIDDQIVHFDLRAVNADLYSLIVNGNVFSVHVREREGACQIRLGHQVFDAVVEEERPAHFSKLHAPPGRQPGVTVIGAPMPGLIVRLEVQPGERVEKGQGLVVIEAMKMENEIKAPVAGTIVEVLIVARASVEKGAPLFKIKT